MGLQMSATYTVTLLYFDKWLGLVSGLSAASATAASILFPYLIKYLDDFYGWRGALIILGGIELQSIVCGALYCEPFNKMKRIVIPEEISSCNSSYEKHLDEIKLELKSEKNETIQIDKTLVNGNSSIQLTNISVVGRLQNFVSVFQIPAYTVFCGSELCFMTAVSIVFTHMGAYTKYLGFTTDDAALFFLTTGVTSTFAKILTGLITQIPHCHPLHICLSSLLLGAVTSLFSFYTTRPLLLMYATFFGVLISPYMVLQAPIAKCIIPIDNLTIAIGFFLFFWAPAYLLGGPIAGWYTKYEEHESMLSLNLFITEFVGSKILPFYLTNLSKI